ncbi:hypothetical protein [Tunturiibacter gelidoferens]|uniref:Uncharacterized protein n=1 Tax=Tunturiibacter gelidiferens TaxID=3069689 RepID=A0ACC5P1A8_9BACT|nr:hypothetical protein [Edaphobacter lichenicola]MBB5340496.1 hypothetical protein [Edaphobacter lichenicola]
MRHIPHRILFAALILTGPIWAQMHKVAKPEQVVRAVGVYEWTGDFAKPTASRLIPVSLFIDGKLEDAGIYVARPVPFALLSGNVYELQTAGIDKGYLDLAYAKHLQAVEATGDLAYDDGWFGYGSVKPLAAPKKAAALKPSKTLPVLTGSKGDTSHQADAKTSTDASNNDDPNRPTMKRRSDNSAADASNSGTPSASTTSTGSTSADDPDRPTMKRRSDSSTSDTTTASTGSTPADDPDRPTMKRRSDSADTSATASSTPNSTPDDPDRPTMKRQTSDTPTTDTGSTTASAPTPSDDPDRPTLKRHSAEDAKRAHDTNSVAGTGNLNDDPSRPNLHRGKPTSAMTETDLPKLVGIPQNLHQMVAVSDAANRDPHAFTLEWEDAAQHAAVLSKMQAMAQTQLAAYASPGAKPPAATPPSAVKKTTTTRTHRTTSITPPTVLLSDEELKAYTLSYGGAATYVYSAHTAGTGAALRYVTIVAQDNGLGELKPAIQNVTDAAHLDRTPLMRFVDVVDAEASNRASLLFELRGQNARQFGLYRVIASHSEQIFLTGTTQ